MSITDTHPEFSVIIACVNGLPFIAECLDALENRNSGIDVEVIVVDATGESTIDFIAANFPNTKLIALEKRIGIPEMRAIGMEQAKGRYLVVTEDHCIAPRNWFEEFKKVHADGYPVAGGSVQNGCTTRIVDWAAFLCEYSAFMPPIASDEVDYVAGNNVSYSRDAIEQVSQNTKSDFWEYFLQIALKERGHRFYSSPSISVVHKKEFGFLYFLSQRFHYSRSFAAMRSSRSSFSKNMVLLAYTAISPFHLTWKIILNVFRKKKHRKELALSLPILAVFMCSYALGELVGQVFGPGNSLQKVE